MLRYRRYATDATLTMLRYRRYATYFFTVFPLIEGWEISWTWPKNWGTTSLLSVHPVQCTNFEVVMGLAPLIYLPRVYVGKPTCFPFRSTCTYVCCNATEAYSMMCAITSTSQPIKQFATFFPFHLKKKWGDVSNFYATPPKGLGWPLFFTAHDVVSWNLNKNSVVAKRVLRKH